MDFGDLILSGLTAMPDFNNLTVRESLALLNSALGGAQTADSPADLDLLARQLSGAFFNGPSTFALDHLNAPETSPASNARPRADQHFASAAGFTRAHTRTAASSRT
jgi:hypothetical protein